MKTIFKLSIFMVAVFLFSGCNSVKTSVEFSDNLSKSSYENYTGRDTDNINVKADRVCQVAINIDTKDGKLNVSITDENGVNYYEGNDLTSTKTDVTLDKQGKYIVLVDADKHTGSYDITWTDTSSK